MLGGSPWKDWEDYIQGSPGFYGREVQADTLIFHGTQDYLLVGIAENFFYDIDAGGSKARMLRFLGEPHGVHRPGNQYYAAQEQIQWFREHLRPEAQ